MKLQETLRNWGGVIVNATTDEEISDIDLAIKYEDHGDEFLYIRTKSGEQYEYGFWFNRKGSWDMEFDANRNSGEADSLFIRRPILYKIPDERNSVSNKIYSAMENEHYGILRDPLIPRVCDDAECRVDTVLTAINDIIQRNPNVWYHQSNCAKKYLLQFIRINNLDDEYVKKVEDFKWDSRVNGFDGLAGKMECDEYLYGDCVHSVLYRGKGFDINKCTYSVDHTDEWGERTYCLNTRQFC